MPPITVLVLVHVFGAVIGLLSGFLSIVLRKGSNLHRLAGTVFAVSMVTMASSAMYLAAFERPNPLNLVASTLTLYLVATGWLAGRRREMKVSTIDILAFLLAAANGIGAMAYAVSATVPREHAPKGGVVVFGTIALLFAVSDVRTFLRGGVVATKRLARHLWRSGLALMMATLSFFPGQAKLLPPSVKTSGLMWAPHLFLAAITIYWLIRVSRKRRSRLPEVVTVQPAAVTG